MKGLTRSVTNTTGAAVPEMAAAPLFTVPFFLLFSLLRNHISGYSELVTVLLNTT